MKTQAMVLRERLPLGEGYDVCPGQSYAAASQAQLERVRDAGGSLYLELPLYEATSSDWACRVGEIRNITPTSPGATDVILTFDCKDATGRRFRGYLCHTGSGKGKPLIEFSRF